MSRFKRFLRSSRGASAVEFALVAPIFFLLVFGIIDFGRIFNSYITITHAAREAARWAAVCDSTLAWPNGCSLKEADVRQRAKDRAAPTVNITGGVNQTCIASPCSCVDVATSGSTTTFPGIKGDYVTVTINQFVAVTTPLMSQFFDTGCDGTTHGITLTTSSSYYREF